MPTYDYRCDACGAEFEIFQSITAPVKRKCPTCGKPKLRRLVGTGAGIIFKGSGFYQTDYRSESYRKAADAESKVASESGKGEGARSSEKADSTKPAKAEADPAPKVRKGGGTGGKPAGKRPKPASGD